MASHRSFVEGRLGQKQVLESSTPGKFKVRIELRPGAIQNRLSRADQGQVRVISKQGPSASACRGNRCKKLSISPLLSPEAVFALQTDLVGPA